MASSMETVESLTVPPDEVDSDKEWEKVADEVEIARATLVHNMEAHSDEVVNFTLTSFATVEIHNSPLSTRLQEMDQAMAKRRECARFSRITCACAFKPFRSSQNSKPPRWTWTSGVSGSGAETLLSKPRLGRSRRSCP